MQKLIVIVGATASGKSSLALKLATDLETEIVSADAFQIYKEINVGINKPTAAELELVKHYFVNSHSIYDEFDIKYYQDACIPILNDIISREKTPIICGGSNLYIDAVIKGYELDKTDGRNEVTHFDSWNYDDIYNYVLEKDQEEALKINYENKKRIIRAAQIIFSTNQKKSTQDNQVNNYVYDVFIIETVLDRPILHDVINKRVDVMLSNNWLEEVLYLNNKDNNVSNLKAFQAIGYKQLLDAHNNNINIDIEIIKQLTRQLSKRQMTWNRNKYKEITRFDTTKDDYLSLLNTVKSFISNKKI
ncbi:MAG: tRNA (adenosine(37)-N6)-dimethylallyltransferase MiaA [Mycoplasma sp.]